MREGRYPVTEAEETTKEGAAYGVDCPPPEKGGCGEPAGFRCVYTTEVRPVDSYGYRRTHVRPHKIGDMTRRPPHVRSNLATEKAGQREPGARRRAEQVGQVRPGRPARQIRAALADFDRR